MSKPDDETLAFWAKYGEPPYSCSAMVPDGWRLMSDGVHLEPKDRECARTGYKHCIHCKKGYCWQHFYTDAHACDDPKDAHIFDPELGTHPSLKKNRRS